MQASLLDGMRRICGACVNRVHLTRCLAPQKSDDSQSEAIDMALALDDAVSNRLLARLDELVRWRPGAKGQYLDLHSALERIQGETNHVITGRRGSGKTRLLEELRSVAEKNSFRVVSIGAEDYKELTYPDILIQILRSFLHQFHKELRPERLLLSSAWCAHVQACFRHPVRVYHASCRSRSLCERIKPLLKTLDDLLAESDELDAEYSVSATDEEKTSASATVKTSAVVASADANNSRASLSRTETNRRASQREVKRTKVERLLGDFKRLLADFCTYFDARLILAVDDFYFIRRSDQPKVIDYMHRICKDTKAFLKIATIKHRTALSEYAEVARGVVPGHEIQSIDLELPLGEFASITRFLHSIWDAVCREVGIDRPADIFVGDGFDQAVLASGGVPRDFFGIVKEALLIAGERRENGVGKRRINEAARLYAENTKFPELRVDIARDQGIIELLLFDIIRFAREIKKKNCFHIDLDVIEANQELRHLLDALADSRLVHLISDNTSSTRRTGRYAAYLLDVGLYGHPERRNDRAVAEVKFWERDAQGRLMHLSRVPIYPIRSVDALEKALAEIRDKGMDIRTFILEPDPKEGEGGASEASRQVAAAMQMLLPGIDEMANGAADAHNGQCRALP